MAKFRSFLFAKFDYRVRSSDLEARRLSRVVKVVGSNPAKRGMDFFSPGESSKSPTDHITNAKDRELWGEIIAYATRSLDR